MLLQLAELPPEDWSLTDEELSKRRDLRWTKLLLCDLVM